MSFELAGIFGAGLLTFVTPCVLPLIPIYLALLLGGSVATDDGKPTLAARLSLFVSTLVFSAGLLSVFVALGMTATSLGRLLTEYRTQFVLVGGLLILLFGLKFLGVLRLSWLEREKRLDDRKLQSRYRLLNALVMGVVFGLGWTPCIGPILGSVLTYTASKGASLGQGALYLGAYGLGFVLPLLILSLFADAARRVVRRISPWLPKLERVSGALMVGVGLYLMLGVGAPPSGELSPADRTTKAMAKAPALQPALGQPTERPRLVQFHSARCSICRQMIPTVGVIERDCDGRKVDVVKVDVHRQRTLATSYRVRGVPTFVFLDKQGNEAARLVGYQTLAALRQSLSAVTGQSCDGLGAFDPTPPPQSTPPANSTCAGDKPAAQAPSKGGSAQCGS